jgi:type II secretory pathway pseudopilin PulG
MTLVEVMIAFTIMIAVLCGSLTAMQSGYKAIDTARTSTLAAQVMQSQIENLRLKNWTQISALHTPPGTPIVTPQPPRAITFNAEEIKALLPESAQDAAGRFTMTQTIADIEEAGATRSGMKQVTLKVDWTGVGGVSHTRTFVTRYSQSGLYDYYTTRR